MKRCAFLSMESLAAFECYDELAYAPLAALGWQVEAVPWRKSGVDWSRFDAVVIRSPWDYQDDPSAFLGVLEVIENSRAVLENPIDLVRWNLSKTYLRDLHKRGVEIVPTLWRQAFGPRELERAFAELNAGEVVIKPVVSANADHTYRISRREAEALTPELERTFRQRPFMLQPFLDAVVEEGEFSLFFFAGEYSHAILKTPRRGDFRVQEEHGGRIRSVQPDPRLLEMARRAMAAVLPEPLYARADFVRIDGSFALMELEMIEPSLYFNMDEHSSGRFADAFAQRMRRAAENLL